MSDSFFPKPPGYVEWSEKLKYFKACADYEPPQSWEDREPGEVTWALLKRYPVAVPCSGSICPLNPRGSGHYGVIRMDLADHAELYRSMEIRTVIPCKEQLLNRYAYEMVEAWPVDTLSIVPAAATAEPGQLQSILEGVFRRNGLWAQAEDEIIDQADIEAEEYSDASSVSDRLDGRR